MSNQPTRPDKNPDLHNEEFGFDFGTSPHGLSAGLPLSHQETAEEAASCPSPAKPLLTLPGIYRSEKVRSACLLPQSITTSLPMYF